MTSDQGAPTMTVDVRDEHRWLARLAGDWTYETEMAEPGQAPQKMTGGETGRMIGEVWLVFEGEGESPGGKHTSIMTLGFDPQKERFVGSYISSGMPHLWPYEGQLDAQRRVLTLDSEGPAMTGEGTAAYRDEIELESDDVRIMRSSIRGDAGQWQHFMTARYTRRR